MNFQIRKFYNTDMSDAGVGAVAETAPQETPSIAALMAKQGVKRDSQEMVEKPLEIKTEKKEKPKPAEKHTSEETSTDASKVETAKLETPTPKVEPEKVQELQKEVEQPKVPSWQEVIKSQQSNTVLKELGYNDEVINFVKDLKEIDPKVVGFLKEYKEKGIEGIKPYLKEWTTDYNKMSAEEVMRHQLRAEYPKASENQLNILFKKEVVEAYNLDSEDDDLKSEGTQLLEAKAERFRDKLTENQQKFLFPSPPQAKAETPDIQEQEAQQKFEAYKSSLNTNSFSKEAFDNKRLLIGKGDDKFNYPIDPEAIKELLLDSEKWNETQWSKEKNPDGSFKYIPKIENQVLTAAFAMNPQKFLDEYAKHYISVGGEKAIVSIDNPSKITDNNTQAKTDSAPKNAAEAMAKAGYRVSGGG